MAAPNEPVQIANGRQIAASFKVAEQAMKRDLRRAHAATARKARSAERSAASSGTRLQARMAGGIGSSASATAATLTLRNVPASGRKPGGGTVGGAPGAFTAYFGSYRTHDWIGNSGWTIGGTGGPRVINPTLRRILPSIEDDFLDGQAKAIQEVLNRRH